METVGGGGVKGRPAVLVLLVDLGPVLDQDADTGQVIIEHGLQHGDGPEQSASSSPSANMRGAQCACAVRAHFHFE